MTSAQTVTDADGRPIQTVGRRKEAVVRVRLLPGTGQFPIAEALATLRADAIIDVEVPQHAARKAGEPPLDRARRAVEATRKLVAAHMPQETAR